jgi:hypothetical protein
MYFSSVSFVMKIRRVLRLPQHVQWFIRALLLSDRNVLYTRRILRNALNTYACASRASTSAWEYALSCSGRRHLDDCTFQLSKHGLHGTVIVWYLRKESRSHTECMHTGQWRYHNCSWGCNQWSSWSHITLEMRLVQSRSSKYLVTINFLLTGSCGNWICFRTVILYRCNSDNSNIIMLLMTNTFWQNSVDKMYVTGMRNFLGTRECGY